MFVFNCLMFAGGVAVVMWWLLKFGEYILMRQGVNMSELEEG